MTSIFTRFRHLFPGLLAALALFQSAQVSQAQSAQGCCTLIPDAPNNLADALIKVTYGSPAGVGVPPERSSFTIEVQPGNNVSPTPPIPAGKYAAWCFDAMSNLDPGTGTLYGGNMFSTCDPNASFNQFLPDHPGVKQGPVLWKQLNYLINHRTQTCNGVAPTMWEVQFAIWKLFGQSTVDYPAPPYPSTRAAVVQCLVDAAKNNAANWVPACGDKIAVIFNISANWDNVAPEIQLVFAEVPCQCAGIGDRVWIDTNGNGFQDSTEVGLGGVTVQLLDCSGNVLDTTTTDGTGIYKFINRSPGNYKIKFLAPIGYAFSPKDNVIDDNKDSDADVSTRETACTTLGNGETDISWDAGLYIPASISGYVYVDLDDDGDKDGSEPAIPGVTVTLTGAGPDGFFGTGDDTSASVPTTSLGYYEFTNLPPGLYRLNEVQPVDYIDGKDTQGTPGNGASSNDQFADITLLSGVNGVNNNFGERVPAPSVQVSNDAVCEGKLGTLVATVSGSTAVPFHYSWSGPVGTGPFPDSASIVVGVAGNYTVVVTDNYGLTGNATGSLVVYTGPSLTLVPKSLTCNGSNDGSIMAMASGGTPDYAYTIDGVNYGPSSVFGGLGIGTYTVTVVDAHGCMDSKTVTITEPPVLVVKAEATPIGCYGGESTVTVTATGGTAPYTGTGTFTKKAGSYSFPVSDANGCTMMATVTISEPTVLVVKAEATPIGCYGGDSTVTVTATGGTAPYTGTGTFTKKAGSYSFPVSDANGCTMMATVTIGEPTAISLALAKSDATCAGNDGTVTATFSGGTAPYTIIIDNAAPVAATSPKVFGALTAGSHVVTVKDANSCTMAQTIVVSENCQLALSCQSSSGQVGVSFSTALTVTGGTAPYTYGISSGVLPGGLTINPLTGVIAGIPTESGSFCFTAKVTDAKGRTATAVCASGCAPGCGCSITIAPGCQLYIAGVIRGDCDRCVDEDRDHDDRDHDGKDHANCNHKHNECGQDGKDHSKCRHERGWCSADGRNHSSCDHKNDRCSIDTRDHSSCNHVKSICSHDGHKHTECNHARGMCSDDGRDHDDCNHRYAQCSLDGQNHTYCRHSRGWCSRDGRNHGYCSHSSGRCTVDTRDHSGCSHGGNICSHDGHEHGECNHTASYCKRGPGAQCGLAGFKVQLKDSTGAVVQTQTTAADGSYRFSGLSAGTYQVVVLPAITYTQVTDPDGTLDNKTTVVLADCKDKPGVDFSYKDKVLTLACITGVIHGPCDLCGGDDRDHDDRDHDGRDHSKCNHRYNQCSLDGRDHTYCQHNRGWCNRDGHDHYSCDHTQCYNSGCGVDNRDHTGCNHYRSICNHDGHKHTECDHSRGLCSHDGRNHESCNHRYAECSRDGQDHADCRHERGWCKRDGRDHSRCSHDNDRCAVDTRDHAACNHSIGTCLHDGHDHSICDHARRGCSHDKSGRCGLAGATVSLKNSAGAVVASVTTGLDGAYKFQNLVPGAYTVLVTPPASYTASADPDGVLDDRTSVTLVAGQCKKCVDFGYKAVVPAAPTGVTYVVGAGKVTLNWTASPGATSYTIGRSTCKYGPYNTIATGVVGTTYTDSTVVNGTAYYYVINAVRNGVSSGNSVEVSAIPAAALPGPWVTKDIGVVSDAGAASYSSGRFTLVGSGADIWNSADEFRYTYQVASGDCTIVARVASVGNVDPWSKAGVMIRESLTDTSKHASVFVTPGNGVAFQYRATTAGGSSNVNTTGLGAPYWVKMVRIGSTFSAYRSYNGSTWTYMGSTTISMGSTVYIGVAVTSHKDGDLCPAMFDYVTATP